MLAVSRQVVPYARRAAMAVSCRRTFVVSSLTTLAVGVAAACGFHPRAVWGSFGVSVVYGFRWLLAEIRKGH